MTQELTQKQHIAKVAKEVLVREARINITPDELTDDEMLNSGLLRINSMSFLGILISLEAALNIQLEDELFMKTQFRSVGDLVNFIYQAKFGSSAS